MTLRWRRTRWKMMCDQKREPCLLDMLGNDIKSASLRRRFDSFAIAWLLWLLRLSVGAFKAFRLTRSSKRWSLWLRSCTSTRRSPRRLNDVRWWRRRSSLDNRRPRRCSRWGIIRRPLRRKRRPLRALRRMAAPRRLRRGLPVGEPHARPQICAGGAGVAAVV